MDVTVVTTVVQQISRMTRKMLTPFMCLCIMRITGEKRVEFDPKIGFVIKNATMNDSGEYTCEDGEKEKLSFYVTITRPLKLPRPSIDKGKNQHFVKGDKFTLECSIVDRENITFSWSYPNQNANYTDTRKKEYRGNTTYEKSILEVPEASEADTGNYTCFIYSSDATPNNISTNITIKETMEPFVFIKRSGKIDATEGESSEISWKAELQSYPTNLSITYTDWKGQELGNTDRITIEYNDYEAQSWLRFKNINSSDFGNYTITVSTSDGAAKNSTSVLFEVKSVPHMTIDPMPPLMDKGEILNVTCLAQGFPIANISLMFQDCSLGYTSCGSFSSLQTIEEDIHFPDPGNIVQKSISFTPSTSGFLRCTGENDRGLKNKTVVIQISDIDGIFVLRHFGQDKNTTFEDHDKFKVVENDHFTLLCGGSKFNYSKVVLERSPQFDSLVHPQEEETEFSFQSKIMAGKATKNLAGKYTCTAYPHGNESRLFKSIDIAVDDEEHVHFEKASNMKNQTEMAKEDKPFSLKCIVTGTPRPTIQWMKGNEKLTNKSSSFDERAMGFSSDLQVLTFKYVLKKHTGLYTCTAKNRLNEVTSSLTLRWPDPGLSTGAKTGLAIAFIGIAALAVVVVFLMKRVKKEQQIRRSFKELKRDLFEKGNIDSLNPACTADTQAEMLPYDKKNWEMPRQNITLGKQLGAGAFGRVIKATVTGLEGPATTTVAIKMSKNEVDASQTRALISELKIMMHLGKHLNIVNLLGANTEGISTGELWILVEYCRFGNLLEFMKRHRRKFTNQICPETGKINHYMVPHSPTSLSSEGYPSTSVDQEGYLVPSAQKSELSDPPLSRSTGTVPSSTSVASASENSNPQGPTGQLIINPMYTVGIGAATVDLKEKPEGSEDSRKPDNFQRKGSRLLSIGSITLSDSSSVNHPLKSPDTNTDTHLMGETGPEFILEVGNVPGVTAPFSTSDLICWGWQVAHGMDYLSRRKILHGDLAARNLLLADRNVVKISDFGLSRNMYRNHNYVKKGAALWPVMWMSVEAIHDGIFSIESDVWAFGITLWEIFSLGNTPYAGMKFDDYFMQKLKDGYRMSCPQYANQEIYNIMEKCWEKFPLERPSFSQLVEDLGHMVMPDLRQEYLSQNEMYVQMNEERFKNETDYLNMMASPNFESQTMPEEAEGSRYVNVPFQTGNSDSARLQLPDTAVCDNAEYPSSSHTSSPGGSDYLAMDSFKQQTSPSHAISPHPSKPSRVSFSSSYSESSRLTSLPEEDKIPHP